jgi:oxysterol-binding protein-related protein 9/10/11
VSPITLPPIYTSSAVFFRLFYGQWPDVNGRGRTDLLVEQVSHHPPITAYVIENKSKGIKLVGHNAQKTSFSGGSIIVKQIGHAVLTVKLPSGEAVEYLLTLPRLRIDGLWQVLQLQPAKSLC